MRLGFVGVGHIARAMVTGLASSDHRIWLSPRNAETAADLARRFANTRVAPSNQAVLDESDVVVLALPPHTARDAIAELRFRADHCIISVISGLPLKDIVGATDVTRAVPLPSVADRAGPTAIYPPNAVAAELFGLMGTAIPVEREQDFEAFCAVTATIASHLAFSDAVATWLARQGVPDGDARAYVHAMLRGVMNGDAGAAAHATPGGINEQLLQHLERQGVFAQIGEGLDAVLRRINAPIASTQSRPATSRPEG